MAKIAPFRGIRYNVHKVGDLSKVVSQPYDRVRYGLQDEYYDLHPYNIVRIIKGREFDNDDDNAMSIPVPATFTAPGWMPATCCAISRRPFTSTTRPLPCLMAVSEPARRLSPPWNWSSLKRASSCPTSGPTPGAKVDRLNLLRATETNFGQIFMLYPDAENRINALFDAAIAGRHARC